MYVTPNNHFIYQNYNFGRQTS